VVRPDHASAGAVPRDHPTTGLGTDRPCALGRPAPTGREPAGRAAAQPVRNAGRAHQHRRLLLVLPLGRLRLAARQPLGGDHGSPRRSPRPTGAACRGAGRTPRPSPGPGLPAVRRSAGRSARPRLGQPLGSFFPSHPTCSGPKITPGASPPRSTCSAPWSPGRRPSPRRWWPTRALRHGGSNQQTPSRSTATRSTLEQESRAPQCQILVVFPCFVPSEMPRRDR
jgi:hypothetical protein